MRKVEVVPFNAGVTKLTLVHKDANGTCRK